MAAHMNGYAIPDYNPYTQFSDIQHFTFLDKYANYLPEECRRETWLEAVTRSVDSLKMLSQEKLSKDIYQRIFDAIYRMDVLPSMRLFSMPRAAIERDNSVIYNCAFRGIDSTQAMAEMLYLGMSGCGTGFSVEKRFIQNLPTVQRQSGLFLTVIIEDSQIAWAKTYKYFLDALFAGTDVHFDYSQIRPAGARLATKGGYSSGAGVLKELHDHVRTIILGAQGRKLNSVEVLDIVNYITQAAISGGSRRAAQIALGDPDDNDFLTAKTNVGDKFWRWNSNNSAVWDDETPLAVKEDLLHELYVSGGEPGIFNRSAAIKNAPSRRNFGFPEFCGTNPCQPEFATVLTPEGIRTFGEIDDDSIIWSGSQWTNVIKKWQTGIKPVYAYKTSAGVFIGTENHRIVENGVKVEVKEAVTIDVSLGEYILESIPILDPQDIMDGLVIGDGSVHKASNNLVLLNIGAKDQDYFKSEVAGHITKYRPGVSEYQYEIETTVESKELPHTYERLVPDRFYYGNRIKKIGFLRGLFSANGSVTGGNKRVGLKQASYILIRQVQEMLSSLGIKSYITVTKETDIQHKNGVYTSKQSYCINITGDRYKFLDLIGFIQGYKNEVVGGISNNRKDSFEIYEAEYLGDFPVYDITVDAEEHTYWTGGVLVSNCAEVTINSRPDGGEFCNLSTTIIRAKDTARTISYKIYIASVIGTIQSMATNFPFLESGWKTNQEQDRLLGVCITGITDNAYLRDSTFLHSLKDMAVTYNEETAKQLGIERSAAVTAVKPSGNTSALADTTPGVNPRHCAYAKRNILVNENTAMYEFLTANEVPFFDHPSRSSDKVFIFPYAAPEGVLLQKDFTAIQQCQLWEKVKNSYTEHSVSVSIQYEPEEFPVLKDWILENADQINGMAFFKNQNAKFAYLPIQEVNKAEYMQTANAFPSLNWQNFGFYEQARDERHEVAECSGGNCLVSF